MPTYLTPAEAAERLGVSRQQVVKYMADGRIPSVSIAGRRVIDERHAKKKPAPKKPGPKPAK